MWEYTSVDKLIPIYTSRIEAIHGTVFEVFRQFYNSDLSAIDDWFDYKFNHRELKDNKYGTELRSSGKWYCAKGRYPEAFDAFSKSLCKSTSYGEFYIITLWMRAMCLMRNKQYVAAITDLDHAMSFNHPTLLRPKLMQLRAESLYYMGADEECKAYCDVGLDYARNEPWIYDIDRERLIDHFTEFKNKPPVLIEEPYVEPVDPVPELTDGENPNFAYASNKVKLAYNKEKGRHVLAAKPILRGDVLFVEKPFIWAPVYQESKDLHFTRCTHCLKELECNISCPKCTFAVFCNEECRAQANLAEHRWECYGFVLNIWYELGIALPAFRAAVKGLITPKEYAEPNTYEGDLKKFGDKEDNYRYFNRLNSHLYRKKNLVPFTIMAACTVQYLKKYTDFFPTMLEHPNCPKKDLDSLIVFMGGLLCKHMGQLASNMTVIEHWLPGKESDRQGDLVPDQLKAVATGAFPATSMMNHSCKANIKSYFAGEVMVVQASEDIAEGEEVFNCYGIDWRTMIKDQRQIACKQLYNFTCNCVVCSNPEMELELLDCYKCPKCLIGSIPEVVNVLGKCRNCEQIVDLHDARRVYRQSHDYIEKGTAAKTNKEALDNYEIAAKLRESILPVHNKGVGEAYTRCYNKALRLHNWELMYKYVRLWVGCDHSRCGNLSRYSGVKMITAAIDISDCLIADRHKYTNADMRRFMQNLNDMVSEGLFILKFHYPAETNNKVLQKIYQSTDLCI